MMLTQVFGALVALLIMTSVPGKAIGAVKFRSTPPAPPTWPTMAECWATLAPTLRLMIDEVGPRMLIFSKFEDSIEGRVSDPATGGVVFRARCFQIGGHPPRYRRNGLSLDD
jgi:hypothetical protein